MTVTWRQISADVQAGKGLAGTVLQNQSSRPTSRTSRQPLHHDQQLESRRALGHPLVAQAAAANTSRINRANKLMTPLWSIRILFLLLCTLGGYASARRRNMSPFHGGIWACSSASASADCLSRGRDAEGFFRSAPFPPRLRVVSRLAGRLAGDHSGLFGDGEGNTRQLIRLALFLGFGYIGMVLAMRSNKEDFSLIHPLRRFSPQNKPDNLLLLDTSVIIDGRIADLIEARLVEGLIVVPGSCCWNCSRSPIPRGDQAGAWPPRLRDVEPPPAHSRLEVRIHDGDFPEEKGVDAKLVRLARNLNAKLFTNDTNLAKVASLQSVQCVNLHEISHLMKAAMIPGEVVQIKIVREGRDKGQGSATCGRHHGHRQQRPAAHRPAGRGAGPEHRADRAGVLGSPSPQRNAK